MGNVTRDEHEEEAAVEHEGEAAVEHEATFEAESEGRSTSVESPRRPAVESRSVTGDSAEWTQGREEVRDRNRTESDDRYDRAPGRREPGTQGSHDPADGSSAVDRSPARTSTALGIVFAVVASTFLWTAGVGFAVGLAGSVVLVVGILRGSRRTIGYGTAVLLVAIGTVGLQGAPMDALLASTLATVLAWDAGRYGIRIGEQLGRNAATARNEIAHVAASVVVGVVTLGLGLGAYRLLDRGGTVEALLLVLVGTALLVTTFLDWELFSPRDRREGHP